MDNTLSKKMNGFEQAIETLEDALNQEKTDYMRDSVIKRFEYCFELCWKTVKTFLREKHGAGVASPKEVFRQLRIQGNLSDEDTKLALQMTDDRNEIIHTYNKDRAEEMSREIREKYAQLLRKIYSAM